MQPPVNEMARKHVIITGTGRAGTTFLVELLTRLGKDTGFDSHDLFLDQQARAGLEHDVRKASAPYIVKNPHFCDYAHEVLGREDIIIERVFIPMRDLHAAAESRRQVLKAVSERWSFIEHLKHKIRPRRIRGGLWHTNHVDEQESVLLTQVYKLVLALSDSTVPVTLLRYPRLVKDSSYLFEKLTPILGQTSFVEFQSVFHGTVRPDWVHTFTEQDI